MKNQFEYTREEINWKSHTIYVDIETGEQLTKEEVQKNYIKSKSKKQTHVKNKTGTITHTIECRRTNQYRIFE